MADASVQAAEFFAFLYGGLLAGLVWQVCSFLRRRLYNRFFLHALDVAFVSLSSMITALTFYRINGGVFRLYGLIGMAAGALVSRATLGHFLRRAARRRRR